MNKQQHAEVGRRHGMQKQRRRGKPRNKRGCFRVTEQVGCSSRVPPTQTLNLDADISSLLRREIFAGCLKKAAEPDVAYFHYLGNFSGRRGGVLGVGRTSESIQLCQVGGPIRFLYCTTSTQTEQISDRLPGRLSYTV